MIYTRLRFLKSQLDFEVFNTKCIISDKTLISGLWGIVVYNGVTTKSEMLLAFYLVSVLINFVTTMNEFSTAQLFEACVK